MTGDSTVKTLKMRVWEIDNGREVRRALVEEIDAAGSVYKAAQVMGLNYWTARAWVQRLGIRVSPVRVNVIDPGDSALSAAS